MKTISERWTEWQKENADEAAICLDCFYKMCSIGPFKRAQVFLSQTVADKIGASFAEVWLYILSERGE